MCRSHSFLEIQRFCFEVFLRSEAGRRVADIHHSPEFARVWHFVVMNLATIPQDQVCTRRAVSVVRWRCQESCIPPGSAQTFTSSHPRFLNHATSSSSKPCQSIDPQVPAPFVSGCNLKNVSFSLCEPFSTTSPPSSGPFGARLRIPWTHCISLRFGFWSTCGHGVVGCRSFVGKVKFMPSNETSSSSVPHSFANASITVGSLDKSVAGLP
jgi:hypothetical protein